MPTIDVDNADYVIKIDMDDERQKALHSHSKLKKEALPVVNNEIFAVSKLEAGFKMIKCHDKLENELQQMKLDNEIVLRQYERCLTMLQQNSGDYIGDEEDYHDQSKSKLLPFISKPRATRRDDDCQQPNTYVAGDKYNNSHVLSEQFRPIQTVGEKIEKDKTTDNNISLTRDMLRIIVSNAFEEQKSWLMLLWQSH